MEKRPLVSVIIPAYNCAGLISRAIESVLIQEVSLEIIVIDDGSGDNLEQVLETYRDNPAFSFILLFTLLLLPLKNAILPFLSLYLNNI